MTKRRLYTQKQRKRHVANSKVRKNTREAMVARLNGGEIYVGKASIMPKSRVINGPGDKPVTVIGTFFHWRKEQIKENSTPSRYRLVKRG